MNDIREHAGPLVIAHFAKGQTTPIFHVMGSQVRMLVIDERVTDPEDRVFEITRRAHPRVLDDLLSPDETIASNSPTTGVPMLPAKRMASAPVPVPQQPAKRELPSYLKVIK
ncbi:hypothetical protein [Methylobacterium sp. WL120]|uniref:hypothetical protein n=1 Tax=Methylobacterium sp. WL120 TaxID=2603887 RepID=UPI0011CA69FB|nr:hypothetical protein [Methylobacterium sp. WL120]TXM69602.1 hypothetical protein FV229_04465 [Methylobacterium sp. WL120]